VHRALRHLYEPVELRLSPLVGLFHLSDQVDAPSELRRILLDAIHAIKPGPKVPPESNAWRMHQVLCYRFEDQFSQEEVAEQMAVSPRQVRRLEFVAIRALAESLAHQYGVAPPDSPPAGPGVEPGEPDSLREIAAQNQAVPQNELDWLKKSYQREATDVSRLVESALKTGEAMLQEMSTQAVVEIPTGLPPVVGQMTTLRQAVLNLLIAGGRSCACGSVHLQAFQSGEQVILEVWAGPAGGTNAKDGGLHNQSSPTEYLDMARQLAELSGGRLEVDPAEPGSSIAVRLVLPVIDRYSVLVVDDNEDSLRLIERSLEGTQFVFLGERDPEQVIARAEQARPRVILLDIMLPGIDGWELLGRLRAHPALGSVPVIISTILPHEQLSASLGAAGFLRKPVSREALLQALLQQVNRPGPGSR